jgi:hypothetical protein
MTLRSSNEAGAGFVKAAGNSSRLTATGRGMGGDGNAGVASSSRKTEGAGDCARAGDSGIASAIASSQPAALARHDFNTRLRITINCRRKLTSFGARFKNTGRAGIAQTQKKQLASSISGGASAASPKL